VFRRKNPNPGTRPNADIGGPEKLPEASAHGGEANAPSSEGSAMSMNKPPSTPFKPDVPRRIVDIPGAPRRRFGEPGEPTGGMPAQAQSEHSRKLIVGRDISLSGEISACDHLVVEGRIEAKISDCRTIEVMDGGVFKGSAQIEEAYIAGTFEGELSVKGRLRLRGSGVVSGTVRYGELEVEAGGRVIGTMEPLESSVVTPMHETPRPAPAPARDTAHSESN
jgi:cytoskeletal protein CcmA (bactofilin family)